MPYNTSAIPRPDEITGTSTLPLARVKKIISQDEDIAQCSNGAAFAVSVATEEFLRYLTEQAFNVAKSEAKPRKNIQYKDIAAAVAKMDDLQFLSDTVPRTVTYKQIKEKDIVQKARGDHDTGVNGTDMINEDGTVSRQQSIANMMSRNSARNGLNGDAHITNEPMSPARQRISLSMATSPILDRSNLPQSNGHTHPRTNDSDVEMQG